MEFCGGLGSTPKPTQFRPHPLGQLVDRARVLWWAVMMLGVAGPGLTPALFLALWGICPRVFNWSLSTSITMTPHAPP